MTRDPLNRNLVRLESRRFLAKCEAQIALIRTVEHVRDVVRLATLSLPYLLGDDSSAREAQREMLVVADERARELISRHVDHYSRAEPMVRVKYKRQVMDCLTELTGPLAHLRSWAQTKLTNAEMTLQ